MAQFFKPVQETINTRQEIHQLKRISGSSLSYTLTDRTDNNDKLANYFLSFNLPYRRENFASGSTLSQAKPELQQLNVDQIVISNIPKEDYNEILDGRSVTFEVPQQSGATGTSAKTIVSSTYNSLKKKSDNEFLGSNIAFLFSDDVNLPYKGTINGGQISKSGNTTWNTTDYNDRPAATPYLALQMADYNSDGRDYSNVSLAVNVPETYPSGGNSLQGYNYDVPVGFVALDKGFTVLTHPDIVNNIPWTQGLDENNNVNTGSTSSTTEIHFSSDTYSNMEFVDIDITYKTSIIALILPNEFYWTTNPSWNLQKNYEEQQNGTSGFDPVYINEIGLYNNDRELIAMAKLDRPLKKQHDDIVTFNLDIKV